MKQHEPDALELAAMVAQEIAILADFVREISTLAMRIARQRVLLADIEKQLRAYAERRGGSIT